MNNSIQPIVKVSYGEVEITYDERADRWRYELRGRERSAESLTKAKEAIDKPEPKEKAPFTRISAYKKSYGEKFTKVEVTSVAEDDYGTPRVWIVQNGARTKERADSLYCVNAKNESLIAEYDALQTEIEAAEEKCRKLMYKMEMIKT